jgi:threonine aldolase
VQSARAFGSDNWSGVHPEVLEALARANEGHAPAYGDDALTARVQAHMKRLFGEQAETFLVFNGTAANVLSLSALLRRPFEAVLCTQDAHVLLDECGALERFTGSRLVPVAAPGAKLTPALLDRVPLGHAPPHHVVPRVVTLTNATELGTAYTPAETRALSQWAHARGMRVHVDGARLANAAAHQGASLRALTTDAGVDVVSFGGTKNGLLGADAVVLLDPRLAADMPYLRKQGMQLASKMRFLATQFDAYLEGDLWLRSARHANAMAQRLAREAAGLPGVEVVHAVEANEVFARLPRGAIAQAQEAVPFLVWDEAEGVVRWVCSFDTTEEDVARLVAALRDALPRGR